MQTLSPLPAELDWCFDPLVLQRHDRAGPRYTSYPTAPHFHEGFGRNELTQALLASNETGRALSLYVHIPFCSSPCFYCGCNRVITRDRSRGLAYVARVLREADQMAAVLTPGREVIQLHLGGGTPNFLDAEAMRVLVDGLRMRFALSSSPQRDFSIELDPRFVTPAEVMQLAALGFNRASLGVQDFDPQVQVAINRVQGVEQTLDIIRACRAAGMRSVNVDLIYGLPGQTQQGFGRTLEQVLAERPDRLAVYGYAHLPNLFRAQRQIDEQQLPAPEQKLALLGLAVQRLSAAGYQYVGMDHFALPEEDLSRAQRAGQLHRNFMGYTTHGDSDLIGLGVSAISNIGRTYSQNPRDLPGWEELVDAGLLPIWRGVRLDDDDLLRAEVIQKLMCQGEVNLAQLGQRHGIDYRHYFADALQSLQQLQDDGLAQQAQGRVRVTAQGRPLLRLLAMCFDRYLEQPGNGPRYSRAI
ncbi:oxygen-independent coproporphyrinogen III oxidase [Stenotrophomonas sp. C3(2023)]|uniref:oxygen-independent coproporphyrinogen III oxidase n=1 Tax=Stenotrophomonas sp. C3(2023) TaxID=3080277 RepID=UPI00293C6A35|nr:oxygen-independent coproporphyrinogen III oxidase [Stenotrophomonas sp. C3(2023)]MDV3469132.1 oxygen-independent coproporphyrinogen III oxidase [Stenotrophomonas sp. C3(2023)]